MLQFCSYRLCYSFVILLSFLVSIDPLQPFFALGRPKKSGCLSGVLPYCLMCSPSVPSPGFYCWFSCRLCGCQRTKSFTTQKASFDRLRCFVALSCGLFCWSLFSVLFVTVFIVLYRILLLVYDMCDTLSYLRVCPM